jgi:glycosyltransferase involved in cell wall biosynthesis
MRVLFYCQVPFALTHGGLQVQITQTRLALQQIGVEVDFLRWYDGSQTGDIVHFFGRMKPNLMQLAHGKGMKVVMAELLTEQGSRSPGRLRRQRLMIRTVQALLRKRAAREFTWSSYQLADACIALTKWEAHLMNYLFGAPPSRVHVVPNGVEDVFLQSRPAPRGQWLVCTATITERKRVLELAEAAVRAKTPVWIIGQAYMDSDPYGVRFRELAGRHPDVIRFEGPIDKRERLAEAYRQARGFVLLSAMESLSLSALEAAACECPLLLSDLPWARTVFSGTAYYCPVTNDVSRTAAVLRNFYDATPVLKPSFRPLPWAEVARQLQAIYAGLLNTSA